MGMDVYGKAPTTDRGTYFRANVWYWHPLATILQDRYPSITEHCTYWHSNDGDGLDETHALALADALRADLDSGALATEIVTRQLALDALPSEPCYLCNATGTRTDDLAKQYGMTAVGGCNACNGTGNRRPMDTWYHPDLALMREFEAFARESGGFTIN